MGNIKRMRQAQTSKHAPEVPKVLACGHFVVTSGEHGTAHWWKVGLITDACVYAAHTRSGVIERFSLTSLAFDSRTPLKGTPIWKGAVTL